VAAKGERKGGEKEKLKRKKTEKTTHTYRKETEASEEEGGQSPAGDHPIAHISPALDVQSASSKRLYTVAHPDLVAAGGPHRANNAGNAGDAVPSQGYARPAVHGYHSETRSQKSSI
jgi:hypothetical protein